MPTKKGATKAKASKRPLKVNKDTLKDLAPGTRGRAVKGGLAQRGDATKPASEIGC
jgi:hypothetical protein